MKSIVIIGGGFSGTATAVNLARFTPVPLHVAVIDRSPAPCRGIAYGTRAGCHLLNVVARNMSALADQPNHFVEWLHTRCEYLDEPLTALREKFVPRRVYGDYLHGLFQWHATTLAAERQVRLERFHDEAEDIVPADGRAGVVLKSGQTLIADKVILAAGNQAPADFRVRGLDVRSPRYIADPWGDGEQRRLPAPDRDVVLVGTGLTMVDVFLVLQAQGWRGKIWAVSRHGLLPLSHFKGFDYPDLIKDEGKDEGVRFSLRRAFALFKEHYRATQRFRLNPAILVDKLRPHTQRLWKNFSAFEKRQFNRHLRTPWNVMRHRVAPEIHRQLTDALAQGRLEVLAGRLTECVESSEAITIRVTGRGGRRVIEAGAVINCTGPRESYVTAEPGLFANLAARGLLQPDEMNMGIRVAADFAVLDAKGNPSQTLYALGSLLKGTLWETTAVPELRSQAFRLAGTIAGQLAETPAGRSPFAEVVEDVIEYFI